MRYCIAHIIKSAFIGIANKQFKSEGKLRNAVNLKKSERGDKRRIDFVVQKNSETQKTKFGKFIFAIYKTNKDYTPIEGSAENLNVYLNCVDATYRLDVIEI